MLALGPVALALALSEASEAYVDGPPPEKTGGFGEQTCLQCHFDGPLDDPEGLLALEGIPGDGYVGGSTYRIEVLLSRPELRRGGFELAARFADGPDTGRQAGSIVALDERVDVIRGGTTPVEYARQNAAGSVAESENVMVWSIQWEAPASGGGPVVFNVAANASNDDASELGDWIYRNAARVPER
jgi:hypothetical protein